MSFCSSCGTRSEASARFCSACGKPLAEQDGKTASLEPVASAVATAGISAEAVSAAASSVRRVTPSCKHGEHSDCRYMYCSCSCHDTAAKAAPLVRATCSEGRHYACGAKDCECECHTRNPSLRAKVTQPRNATASPKTLWHRFLHEKRRGQAWWNEAKPITKQLIVMTLGAIIILFSHRISNSSSKASEPLRPSAESSDIHNDPSSTVSAPQISDAGANKLNSIEGRAAAAISVATQINSKPSEHLSTTIVTSVESPIPTLLFSESDRDPDSLPAGGAAVLSEGVMSKLFSQPDLIKFFRQCGFRRVVVDFQGVVRGRDIPQED